MPRRKRDDQLAVNQATRCSPPRSGRHSAQRANAEIARSISPALRDADRLQLHAQCCATDWMMAHCPTPAGPGSRRTPTRVTRGAISLSSSSHFAAQAVFELDEAGGIAARPRQALDKAVADRIDSLGEHDRHGAARLLQRHHGRADAGQDHIRAKRDQFHRIPAHSARCRPRSSGCRSERCGRPPNPLPAALAGMPQSGPALPVRRRPCA